MSAEETSAEKQKQRAAKARVQCVPGSLFFFKSIALVPTIKTHQLENFVLNSLESISPFLPEQLSWGFSKKQGQILVYAALREHLDSKNDTLRVAGHVFPALAVGHCLAQEGFTLFVHKDEYCLLKNVSGNVTVVELFTVSETDDLLSVCQQVLKKHKVDESRVSVVEWLGIDLSVNGASVTYTIRGALATTGTKAVKKQEFSPSWLWNADVRDKSFLAREKRARSTDRIFRKGMCFAIVVAILLGVLEGALYTGKVVLWHNNRTKNILESHAAKVESTDFLVKKIRNTVEQELRPFELLGILNQFRPDTIWFSSVVIDNVHNVSVEGIAEAASEVESFRRDLAQSKFFEKVTIESLTTDNQGAKFTLFCDFRERNESQLVQLSEMNH